MKKETDAMRKSNNRKLISAILVLLAASVIAFVAYFIFSSAAPRNYAFNNTTALANACIAGGLVLSIILYLIYWARATKENQNETVFIVLGCFVCVAAALVGALLFGKGNTLAYIAISLEGILLMAANIIAYIKFKIEG